MSLRFLKIVSVCLICEVIPFFLPAQRIFEGNREYNFTTYSVQDGLLQGTISCIEQDHKGNLWIGSGAGVTCFDGTMFRNFTSKDGLLDGAVYGIAEDSAGCIWFGTGEGICSWDGKKFTRYDSTTLMPMNRVWKLFTDKDGTIWAGTKKGVIHFDPFHRGKPLIRTYANVTDVRAIIRDKHDSLLFGTFEGVFILRHDSLVHLLSEYPVHCIADIGDGNLYVGSWMIGMDEYRNGIFVQKFLPGISVVNFAEDHSGNLWLATFEKGIYRFDGKDLYHFSVKEGLPSDAFWTVFNDREDNCWFGSWGSGIARYSGNRFSFLTQSYGLPGNFVNGISADTSGHLLFTSDNGVVIYDPSSPDHIFTTFDKCGNEPVVKIMNLACDRNGNAWMPSYTGHGYVLSGGKISSYPWLNGFTVKVDSKGRILTGTDNNGMRLYDPVQNGMTGNNQKTIYVIPSSANRIVGIYEDRESRIWEMNMSQGVNIFFGDTVLNFFTDRGFANEVATAVCEDANGDFWIGTSESGIFRYRLNANRTLSVMDSITVKDGLNSNGISSLIFDSKGDLLAGTMNGICLVNMKSYAAGKKSVKKFPKESGFSGGECTGIFFNDREGNTWIGTAKGAYCFDPAADRANTMEPLTAITGIDLFFETTDWSAFGKTDPHSDLPVDLHLPYNQNHLTFHFNGVSLTAPSGVRYKYMIAGIDKEWSPETTKRDATYSNLQPGTYTFLVKACNSDYTWNKNPVAFTFTIEPPFWQRGWFYFLCAAGAGGALFLFIRLRERKIRAEKKILEDKVKERTSELQLAYAQIEEKNKDITDSINYAKRLQKAVLPTEKEVKDVLSDSFVLYLPKDIVSGDFYWVAERSGKKIVAVVDSTGHGVPGAMMSMIGSSILSEIVLENGITQPDEIIHRMREKVIKALRQQGVEDESRDGFDLALCSLEKSTETGKLKLQFCGANNPLLVISGGKSERIAGDKHPVGIHTGQAKPFTLHTMELQQGDLIYLSSDGITDQFGGEKGKKYRYARFRELIEGIHQLPIDEQKKLLQEDFEKWKGDLLQVDDICVIGIRV